MKDGKWLTIRYLLGRFSNAELGNLGKRGGVVLAYAVLLLNIASGQVPTVMALPSLTDQPASFVPGIQSFAIYPAPGPNIAKAIGCQAVPAGDGRLVNPCDLQSQAEAESITTVAPAGVTTVAVAVDVLRSKTVSSDAVAYAQQFNQQQMQIGVERAAANQQVAQQSEQASEQAEEQLNAVTEEGEAGLETIEAAEGELESAQALNEAAVVSLEAAEEVVEVITEVVEVIVDVVETVL